MKVRILNLDEDDGIPWPNQNIAKRMVPVRIFKIGLHHATRRLISALETKIFFWPESDGSCRPFGRRWSLPKPVVQICASKSSINMHFDDGQTENLRFWPRPAWFGGWEKMVNFRKSVQPRMGYVVSAVYTFPIWGEGEWADESWWSGAHQVSSKKAFRVNSIYGKTAFRVNNVSGIKIPFWTEQILLYISSLSLKSRCEIVKVCCVPNGGVDGGGS